MPNYFLKRPNLFFGLEKAKSGNSDLNNGSIKKSCISFFLMNYWDGISELLNEILSIYVQ